MAATDPGLPPSLRAGFLRQLPRLAAVAFGLFYIGHFLAQWDPVTGLTKQILFEQRFESEALPALRAVPHAVVVDGYDGQFYAEMALDPTLRDPAFAQALDDPPYRGRRVLLSWTAYILGLGRPAWVLNAYVLQYLLLWVGTGFLLTRWVPLDSYSNLARWCGCMFAMGLMASIDRVLPDGATMFFILATLYFLETRQDWRATAVLALAGFARETNVLAAVLFDPPVSAQRRAWLARAWQMAALVVPLAVWMVYLDHHFTSGNNLGTNNLFLPGPGYVAKLVADTYGSWVHPHHNFDQEMDFLQLLTLAFRVVYLGLCRDWRDPVWRLGAIYTLLALFLGNHVWEGYPGAYQRILIPLTFAFNLRLPPTLRGGVLALIGNMDVLAMVILSSWI
jgi:hypothetical protein